MAEEEITTTNFIKDIIEEDIRTGKHKKIITRFPPEPNAYLHIGHAKSICLNGGIANEFASIAPYGTQFNLRFDDTNPLKEKTDYIKAIKQDVKWLGFDWGEHLYFASDYFDKLYEWAIYLIKQGKAYVCHLSPDEIREYRGTLMSAGKESPYRNRSIEENLKLFEKMKNGEFKEGECVLRAKIDMKHPNLNMRDPVMYRIIHAEHPRTGNKWCIYPTYDYAHGQSDAIEGITHSLCTLEFEDHRPLYEWFIENLPVPSKPRQIEFARLNLTYTVMSKRKLLEIVEGGYVKGWDDPRLPTLSGLRRRGFTPSSIRRFCELIGVGKADNCVEIDMLHSVIRAELNKSAERRMCVLSPIKIIIENYPEDKEELLDAVNNPEDESRGVRKVPFSRELYIEREDFMENPVKKFYRLAPQREVRLRWAYFIKCVDIVKDKNGDIKEIICTYDPLTYGGNAKDGRKVKATLHWVSAKHAVQLKVRLYDHLFTTPFPEADPDKDFLDFINSKSLVEILAFGEPSLLNAKKEERIQFERKGYFFVDPVDSKPGAPVFNRIVTLKDTWAKLKKRMKT